MYYYIGFHYTLCSTKMQHFLAKLSRPVAKDEQRVGEAAVASSGKARKCRNNGRRGENGTVAIGRNILPSIHYQNDEMR